MRQSTIPKKHFQSVLTYMEKVWDVKSVCGIMAACPTPSQHSLDAANLHTVKRASGQGLLSESALWRALSLVQALSILGGAI